MGVDIFPVIHEKSKEEIYVTIEDLEVKQMKKFNTFKEEIANVTVEQLQENQR